MPSSQFYAFFALKRIILSVGMLLFILLSAFAEADTTQERVFSNGFKVVVRPDHRAPVAVSQVWYRIGSTDEPSGQTGISHLLEHLMFKGTQKVPAGQFSKKIAAAGGRENAFTSHDYTAYFQQLQADKLPLAFELEADRMQHLQFDEAAFKRELEVVKEERRLRTDNQPNQRLFEQFQAIALLAHPRRQPVIGWMEDLNQLTVEKVKTWYQRAYAPNRATLVVVGDIEPEAIFQLAEKTFGQVPRRPIEPILLTEEPPFKGTRRLSLPSEGALPHLIMGWRVPSLRSVEKDKMPYALEVLTGILEGHPGARLNQALVREKKLALSISVDYSLLGRGPALFSIQAVPTPNTSLERLEKAIQAELAALQKGIHPEELARVKTHLIATQVYERDSVFAQAMNIGMLESLGFSHQDEEKMLTQLKAVQSAEVLAAAKQFLHPDYLTVGTLIPTQKR